MIYFTPGRIRKAICPCDKLVADLHYNKLKVYQFTFFKRSLALTYCCHDFDQAGPPPDQLARHECRNG